MDISILQNLPDVLVEDKKSGFYPYDKEGPKQYAFVWTNDAGKAVLISKFYQTSRSRNRVLEKIKEGQYEIQATSNDAQQSTISILNKNRQVIADSTPFKDSSTRDNILAQMNTSIGKLRSSEASAPQAHLATVVPGQPTRHSFRLVFYRSNEEKNWQGMLSHPLSDEKVNFSGVDTDEIATFVQRHLAKKVTEPDTRQIATPEGIRISWPKVQSITSGQPLTVDWSVTSMEQGRLYEASITAKALTGGTQTLIGRRQFGGEEASQNLSLSAMTNGLEPGMYRLTARLDSVQPETNQTLIKESHLLFLV